MFYQSILIMFIISILFSLYALHPLKKSLSLTNEFIKDILLLRDKDLRERLGVEAFKVAQNLSWDSIVKCLVDYLKERV
jgi:hypothetical protein